MPMTIPEKPDPDFDDLELTDEERQWAMFAHLAALSGYIGVPLGNIIGPLVVWMIKREESSFIDDQGKESLNFQISMLIWIAISAATICIFVGMVTTPILAVVGVVYVIIAAIKSNQGELYRYPLTIRFIR
jgi:uncharacterized Tic20 family protein